MPEPLIIIEEKTHRIRALRDGKAIAKAVRSIEPDSEIIGWLVSQVLPTRQAAIEAVKRLAEDAHPNAEVA